MADGGRLSADSSRLSALGRGTVGDLVEEVARRLAPISREPRAEGREPRAESRELIAALLDVPRHWPLLRSNKWVEASMWTAACAAADARAAGAPLAYAVGRANFRSLTLAVDPRVLIPRPETEMLVDLVLERVAPGGVAVDVGTGCGAIAIALATEGSFERVIATDISSDAIDVARENAIRAGADRVDFLQGDLLTALDVVPGTSDVKRQTPLQAIVSNPPYIRFAEMSELPRSVRDWEPAVALISPGDGMGITQRLIRQAAARLAPGGLLALEVDARRASLVAEFVASESRFQEISVWLDLAGRERFVLATRIDGVHA